MAMHSKPNQYVGTASNAGRVSQVGLQILKTGDGETPDRKLERWIEVRDTRSQRKPPQG